VTLPGALLGGTATLGAVGVGAAAAGAAGAVTVFVVAGVPDPEPARSTSAAVSTPNDKAITASSAATGAFQLVGAAARRVRAAPPQ
jgi:hypothetical protein